jgi:hypothetical protein
MKISPSVETDGLAVLLLDQRNRMIERKVDCCKVRVLESNRTLVQR